MCDVLSGQVVIELQGFCELSCIALLLARVAGQDKVPCGRRRLDFGQRSDLPSLTRWQQGTVVDEA